jgi:hypothetical protein
MHDFAHMALLMPLVATVLTMLGVTSTFTAFLGIILKSEKLNIYIKRLVEIISSPSLFGDP